MPAHWHMPAAAVSSMALGEALGKLSRGRLGSTWQGPCGGAYQFLLGCGYMDAMAVQRTPALLQLLVVAVVSFALGCWAHRYNLETLPHTAQVPAPALALAKPSATLMSNIDCPTFLRHFFRTPKDILGLPPTSALDA